MKDSPKVAHGRALEEGIETIRQAMRDLLAKPKDEREKHLASLMIQLELLASRLEAAGETEHGRERVRATREVMRILRKISDGR